MTRKERTMPEEHVFDLLPGYALGSLDEDDLLKVAGHLPYCVECRNELSTYMATVDAIAQAAPVHNPPPDLRAKILQQASRKNQPEAAPMGGGVLAGLRNFFASLTSHPLGFALGALALLLVFFLAASNFMLWQQVNTLKASLPAENTHIVRMQGTKDAPQAVGYLMVFKGENYGSLVVDSAPLLEPGKAYQLWLIKDGKRTSGGVFSVNEQGYGTLQVDANQQLENYDSFGITIEPAGGSPGPTGAKVLGGKL